MALLQVKHGNASRQSMSLDTIVLKPVRCLSPQPAPVRHRLE
jgi:hypothetical protein